MNLLPSPKSVEEDSPDELNIIGSGRIHGETSSAISKSELNYYVHSCQAVMSQVQGKFIQLIASLTTLQREEIALAQIDAIVKSHIGIHWNEIDPEGWYDTSLFNQILHKYVEVSPEGMNTLIKAGRKIYPTIRNTRGLPDLDSRLGYIIYVAEVFTQSYRC